MPEPPDENKAGRETLRIIRNIDTLLARGLFIGAAAEGLHEAREWTAGMIRDLSAKFPSEAGDVEAAAKANPSESPH